MATRTRTTTRKIKLGVACKRRIRSGRIMYKSASRRPRDEVYGHNWLANMYRLNQDRLYTVTYMVKRPWSRHLVDKTIEITEDQYNISLYGFEVSTR